MQTYARVAHGLGLCLLLLCTGCTGALVDALEARHVQSCIWWQSLLGTARGVTATGQADLGQCLAQRHTWP